MARRPWLGTACLWFAAAICAQAALAGNVPGIDTVHFRTFATGQGLSQATARVIAQDRAGFIWVGTQDGLNRFDGYEFHVYKTDRDDPWSLSQNHVWALAADPDGSLWVWYPGRRTQSLRPRARSLYGLSLEGRRSARTRAATMSPPCCSTATADCGWRTRPVACSGSIELSRDSTTPRSA
ncbi:MAG: two-component regulator propeller domain-containing protein [Dokdonella sp.]